MILPIYSVIRLIDPRLAEAAATLGAGPLRRFVAVTLPGSSQGSPSCSRWRCRCTSCPSLVIGDRYQTLATLTGRAFLFLRDEQLGSTTAVLLLTLAAVAVVVGSTALARRLGGGGQA